MFDNLSNEELEQVVDLLSIEEYAPGEKIFDEGQSHAAIWIVLSGRCQVFKQNQAGARQDLAVIEPVQTFGEMSFFHPAPHSASVEAIDQVKAARLDRARYHCLIDLGSQAAFKMAFNTIGVLSERLRAMDDAICNVLDSDDTKKMSSKEWGEFRSKVYSEWQF